MDNKPVSKDDINVNSRRPQTHSVTGDGTDIMEQKTSSIFQSV